MDKGNILIGNLVFIILNVLFLSIIIIFLFTKVSAEAVLEEEYAKEVALMIDHVEPQSVIEIDMSDAFSKAQEGWQNKLIQIEGNVVRVQLREKGGYSYSFFNDVQAIASRWNETHYKINIYEKENE